MIYIKKQLLTIIGGLILCSSMISCVSSGGVDSTEQTTNMPDTSIENLPTNESKYTLKQLESIAEYKDEYTIFNYPEEILNVVEKEDGITAVNLLEADSFYPRIDIYTIPIADFKDSAFYSLDAENSSIIFQYITQGIVAAYAGIELDQDGFIPEDAIADISFITSSASFNEEFIEGFIMAEITNHPLLKDVMVQGKLKSIDDVGIMYYLVVEIDTDEETNSLFESVFESIDTIKD